MIQKEEEIKIFKELEEKAKELERLIKLNETLKETKKISYTL